MQTDGCDIQRNGTAVGPYVFARNSRYKFFAPRTPPPPQRTVVTRVETGTFLDSSLIF